MKLTIDGEINPHYVQTLCLIFFPGEKFSEKDEHDEHALILHLETRDGAAVAHAVMKMGDHHAEGDGTSRYHGGVSAERTAKIAVGRAIFAAGCALFGITPPWGILSGVRPAKVVKSYLASGLSADATRQLLEEEYCLSPEKASLAVEVAREELKLMHGRSPRQCSVYISIPFCPSRCAYCSFVSASTPRLLSLIPDYISRLTTEIAYLFGTIRALGLKVATIYIGGGTPTVLTETQLERLLSCIAEHTDVHALEEFTLEAGRPDTITPEKMAIAHTYGVSRVSVNTQTLNNDVLRAVGRRHTDEDFFRAFAAARAAGIPAINTDLIAGLPGESFASFADSFDRVAALRPENITVHTFCVKRAAEILRSDPYICHREGSEAAESVTYARKRMQESGYLPYYMYRQKNTLGNLENVGYAQPGWEGLYNILMMEEVHTIFAAGAGAVTKLVETAGEDHDIQRISRIFNPKYPYEYLKTDAEVYAENCQRNREAAEAFYALHRPSNDAGFNG